MIETLISLIRRPKPRTPGTEKLYVVSVNFPMDKEFDKKFDEALDVLRQKYGLDFLILEPGVNLKRFDEF